MRTCKLAIVLLALACDPIPGPEIQCPQAAKRGFSGHSACDKMALHDRRVEFMKANKLTATCEPDCCGIAVECSGVTHAGAPVKFKCTKYECEFIAPWAW